ncbi:MAG TPA: metalloregulator ArsR/SmtB family transcription factor [Solirubrobacterales bacterium]|nr:metalloregulator ArsR/SmtB family transcription factor [Solirubrobacterales bacterium]
MATKIELPHPLPAPLVERIAERFRVLGEPMRIRLLEAMREGEKSVKDLQELTGASQQNVSQHLGVLLRSRIVERRKEGNFSLYSIADPVVWSLCDDVCDGLRDEIDRLEGLLEGSA